MDKDDLETREFETLLELALYEDLRKDGDVSSKAIFSDEECKAHIIAKQDLRISGISLAASVFKKINPELSVELMTEDGKDLKVGEEVLRIQGNTRSILEAERTALNFLGYLSGIATQTKFFVQLAKEAGNTVILDTRKTLPGYRGLAKKAVLHGGGTNHRMGLYDMVMIKDNHIDAAGGIEQAVHKIRALWGAHFRIELECRNLDDVKQALALDVDIAMLDNMDVAACRAALDLKRTYAPQAKTLFEGSGDMDEDRLRAYASLGLDFISVGKLTHSVRNANFSLRIMPA